MEKSCLGSTRQTSPRDNFTERLYDKKLALLTESKLTHFIVPKSRLDIHDLSAPFSLRFLRGFDHCSLCLFINTLSHLPGTIFACRVSRNVWFLA